MINKDDIGAYICENKKDERIIEKYNINGTKYIIQYTDETKASDLFNCLNRMLVQKEGIVNYKDTTIQSMPSIVCIEDRKEKGISFFK